VESETEIAPIAAFVALYTDPVSTGIGSTGDPMLIMEPPFGPMCFPASCVISNTFRKFK